MTTSLLPRRPLMGAALLLTLFLVAGASGESSKPNVVFILADDLGYGDVACFGERRCQIPTPSFDQLAREGMRFTDAHVNASVCVPTRVAIMTGRYPWRFGRPERGGPWGFLGSQFPPSQFTLGTLMRNAGYRTAYVGKWHLGTRMATTNDERQGPDNVDYSKPLAVGPQNYRFRYSFVLPGSLDMFPYAFVKNNNWVGEVTARKGWSAFNRVGPAAKDFEDTQVLDTLASQAESYIARQAGEDEPFFLFLALTAPHTPTSPSKPFQGKTKLGMYGDFVMETDHCIGRVLAALEKHGLTKDTLVMATSDHGPAPYAGRLAKATPGQLQELEDSGHFSSGPFRGYKFSIYEGGLRVPFVARWPGVVEAGSTCDQMIALQDLMRTLSEVTRTPLSANQGVDSLSFYPLLMNADAMPTRNSILLQATRANGIRSGKWKLAMCPGSGCDGRFGNVPRSADAWKSARASREKAPTRDELRQPPFVQLFDLEKDPSESQNVAQDNPEVVADLFALFDLQVREGRSTPGPNQTNGRDDLKPFPAVPAFVWK